MIDSLLLRTLTRALNPLLVAFSVFLLLRGHNEPGGGFIGGLVLGLVVILSMFARGVSHTRAGILLSAPTALGLGLLISLGSGLYGVLAGFPFFTGVWGGSLPVPTVGSVKFGTVFMFDVGVYFVVYGTIAHIALTLLSDSTGDEEGGDHE